MNVQKLEIFQIRQHISKAKREQKKETQLSKKGKNRVV
jgi:hypothetical protein